MTIQALLTGEIKTLDDLITNFEIDGNRSQARSIRAYQKKIASYMANLSDEVLEVELGEWPLPHA